MTGPDARPGTAGPGTVGTEGDAGGVALGAGQVATALAGRCAEGDAVRLVTHGPEGTSASEVADLVRGLLARRGCRASVGLVPRFEDARVEVRAGRASCALVPGAASGATDFHWDPALALLGVLVRTTPAYGLAVRADGEAERAVRRAVVVSSLPEVAGLVDELAPPALRRARRTDRVATSTAAAAEDVARGLADVAVCNEAGRRRHGLRWLASRPGVPMPWSAFVAGDRPGATGDLPSGLAATARPSG